MLVGFLATALLLLLHPSLTSVNGQKDAFVHIIFKESNCNGMESSQSSFNMYLTGLSFDTEIINKKIVSSEFFWPSPGRNKEREYKQRLAGNLHGNQSITDCFVEGYEDCIPRADVLFLQYTKEPPDVLVLDHITVKVVYEIHGQQMIDRYEHPMLQPCESIIDQRAIYQIGPRNGLLIKLSYTDPLKEGTWIRDWV